MIIFHCMFATRAIGRVAEGIKVCLLHIKPLERPHILPHAGNRSLRKYQISESRIMDLGLMNVLGCDVHNLRHVDIELVLIRKSHDCLCLANAMD